MAPPMVQLYPNRNVNKNSLLFKVDYTRFATNIKIDEDDYMLYSLKTRQYYPYKKEAQEQLEKLLDELNKGEYTLEEIQCIEKLMKKGILISDNQDELAELDF